MRALIFTDVAAPTSRMLIEATLAEAERRVDFEVVGFVTANPSDVLPGRLKRLKARAKRLAVWVTGGGALRPSLDLARIARRANLTITVAEAGVNQTEFIARIHERFEPDLLLSYYCTQILREPLLDSFSQAVNYHDGLLPLYGGLDVTAHSVYHGESESGFTFHRIDSTVDGGPILVQGSVPLTTELTGTQVDAAKREAAVLALPEVLDKIEAKNPGTPQSGPGSYFSAKDDLAMTTISDPSSMSGDDIVLRVRAYSAVQIAIDGEMETVTEIETAHAGAPFSFVTSDGQHLRASRIAGLPARLIAARRRLPGR